MNNDKVGLYSGEGFCETYTGKFFQVLNPTPETIDIFDIAHALSMICRFNGHCSRFYSVAEHSVNVAYRVWDEEANDTMVLAALLHDASEAYIGDMTRPLKVTQPMAGYRAAEDVIQKAVWRKFGIAMTPEICAAVKRADNEACKCEAANLMATGGKDWAWGTTETVDMPIDCLEPGDAETQFLVAYREITGLELDYDCDE